MAVCAADLAFPDLRLDARPGTSAASVGRYIRDFVAQMIELEHDDVGLAAVHARVGREIFDDAATILSSSGSYVPQQTRLLAVSVFSVVLASVRPEAVAAPRLELRLAAPHRRKRLKRLQLAAFRARSHEGGCAGRSISRE